jgi:hypothetical protein
LSIGFSDLSAALKSKTHQEGTFSVAAGRRKSEDPRHCRRTSVVSVASFDRGIAGVRQAPADDRVQPA